MNSQLWLYVSIAAVIGLLLGLGLMWLFLRGGKQRQQYQTVKASFDNYRQQVDKHFIDTAGAIDELNRSYLKVLQQLNVDAQQLMDKTAMQEQLQKRGNKSVTLAFMTQSDNKNPQTDDSSVPYTDVTEAAVIPINGMPDQVPDRIGRNVGHAHEQLTQPKHVAHDNVIEAKGEDLQQSKS
ncbi:ZapG family protein [Snodgrassella alvi]|uniref:Z-ring associated protein G n=1 Tax=Snodgrassella alvi TaxID=1196083 RepID=A0A2N9WVU9_9NEIS|nr:DUF1043 family protein [Snodgrassella alvi]PIT15301.1 hypothetical protein BGI34_12635 [Snodgrassella alvi]PIT16374.1 hypothetical protein BGI33_04745 [Snodgrassella alvi]PIT17549.1 hypothetical protein BGI32_02360 [Snodgrassella alvi]